MRLSRRLHVVLITATATGLLLAGCTTTQPEPTEAVEDPTPTPTSSPTPEPTYGPCPPIPIEVMIDHELEQVTGGVRVTATTNLPDGAELMTSFFRESPNYFGQDVQVIEDGRIVAGPFADGGSPLVGTYELSISLSIAATQPEAVQPCLGEGSENLTGPLVHATEYGSNVASLDVLVTFE